MAWGVSGRAQAAGEMFQAELSPNLGTPGPGTLVPCRLEPSGTPLLPSLMARSLQSITPNQRTLCQTNH